MKLKHLLPAIMLTTCFWNSLYSQVQQTPAITGQQQTAKKDLTTHVVATGETLYSIASMYRTSIDEIYRLNPSSKQGIKIGDKLSVPKEKTVSGYNNHLIKTGETLYSVSRTYKVSIAEIKAVNTGLGEDTFHAGKTIRIPVFAQPGQYHKYTVKSGQTIYDVARDNNVSIENLVEINPELMTERVKDGMILVIPKQNETGDRR